MRSLSLFIAIFAVAAFCAAGARAMELVMVRQAGCPWCTAWDRDIGPIYPKTEIGRRVPIRLVDLDHSGDLSAKLKSPVRFTPTFVLIDDGREIGRIEGYPGEDFFWGLLESMVPKPAATNGPISGG